jgi:hypothetical protein
MRVAAPLVLVSALLSACAVAPEAQDRLAPYVYNCHARCDAWLLVPPSCGAGIRVLPDPIIARRGTANEITWHVRGQWTFHPGKGIEIHEAGRAFSKPDRSADGKRFTVVLDSPVDAIFKYDVNLVGPNGRECKIDPVIVNW